MVLSLICLVVISFAAVHGNVAKVGPKYNYAEVIEKSFLFYEAQRSGALPADNRVPWRGDSCLDDGKSEGHDLSGGYFDAGDFVKFGFPMANTVTMLAWGIIEYKEAYVAAGQLEQAHAAVKWGTDYFIKAHVDDNTFYGQCGDGDKDHASWGRPEDLNMERPCWAITPSCKGTDLAAETAAALAAASIMFADTDKAYSEECLSHAIKLYDLGKNNLGMYHECITNAANFYRSWSGYWDELAFGGAWLYKATGDESYATYVEKVMTEHDLFDPATEISWDEKRTGAQILMYKLTNEQKYIAGPSTFCANVVDPSISPFFTPKGLVYISQWGSLRYASNAVFGCLLVADLGIETEKYVAFVKAQIGYVLGDTGRSFVIGFGENSPTKPHHRSSSCPTEGVCDWNAFNNNGPNPQVLYGALVGGPNDQDQYTDSRSDYVANEVATDYNACFTGAVAGLSLHDK